MKKVINNEIPSNRMRQTVAAKPVRSQIVVENSDSTPKSDFGNQALNDFAKRVDAAVKSRATTISLTVNEANAIFANLASVLVSNQTLQDQVFELQKQIIENKNKIADTFIISADGGSFKKE